MFDLIHHNILIDVNFEHIGFFWSSGAYSEHSRISKMRLFEKIVNGFQPLTIFAKNSTLDVWLASECAFELWKSQYAKFTSIRILCCRRLVQVLLKLDWEVGSRVSKSSHHLECPTGQCQDLCYNWPAVLITRDRL